MKNNIIKYVAALGVGAMVAMASCDQLEDEFYNPDKVTDGHLDLFFTSALQQTHLFKMEYGPTYHYINNFTLLLGIGVNPSYTFSDKINESIETWSDWSGQPFNWNIFEKTSVQYTKDINAMKLLYNDMSPEEQATYEVYFLCSDVVKSYAFQRSVDLYDDIPYSEVGGAFQEKFYPKYETQEEIYTAIMDVLKTTAEKLSTLELTSAQASKFSKADILCGGDIDLWIRFANSLRLRMAMRLCHVKPDVAKATIKELLQENKLLTDTSITFEERDKNQTNIYELLYYRGFEEMGNTLVAPRFLVQDLLNYHDEATNEVDPRLYVLFQPNRDGKYIGWPVTQDDREYLDKYYTREQQDSIKNRKDAVIGSWDPNRLVTRYNRATFMNFDMKFQVLTDVEVNLLLAEAAVRWPGEFGSINAVDKVKSAIESSTRYYYELNNNPYGESSAIKLQHVPESARMKRLDEDNLAGYLSYAGNEFSKLDTRGKLEYIFHQKMLHFNILYPYEIFNEAHRLIKDCNGELPLKPMVNVIWCERFYYPTSEATKNAENFEKVKAKNNHTTPVWWSGRTVAAQNPNHTVSLN